MRWPRTIPLEPDARLALGQIVGIMTDQVLGEGSGRWDVARLMELEARLGVADGMLELGPGDGDGPVDVLLGIDDAALLLDGLAFTEVASEELPWIAAVRWTADFITAELRQHWSDDEWLAVAAGP